MDIVNLVQLYVKTDTENENDGTTVLFNTWVSIHDTHYNRTVLGRYKLGFPQSKFPQICTEWLNMLWN